MTKTNYGHIMLWIYSSVDKMVSVV